MSLDRLLVLCVLVAAMFLLMHHLPTPLVMPVAESTLSFGFILLVAYLFASILARWQLPRITGYILAGILFSPALTGLLSTAGLQELKFVDDLALNFIALVAGLELRLSNIRKYRRSIACTFLAQFIVVFIGVTGVLLALRSVFPFTAGRSVLPALAIAAVSGALSLARSPSSCIAIISETRSRGPFTEMVLGVTVTTDVLAILVFALAVSLTEVMLVPGRTINLLFLLGILGEMLSSMVLGVLLGKVIAFYLERVRTELTIFTFGMAFLVSKLSLWLAHLLDGQFDVRFHLEPMLICLAAGYWVQNHSRSGEAFLKLIDRSSLPIYILFFTLSGAALDLAVLSHTWHWALGLVFFRGIFIVLGGYLGGRLAGDPPAYQRYSGLSFLTQAGVSLGLVKLLVARWAEAGKAYATLLVAAITINQIIGPAALKASLTKVGETREARLRASR